MARFLAKIVLTLEPTIEIEKYHDDIREFTAHHKKNLLNLIGVDPVLYQTETSHGSVDLQIWITTTTAHPLNKVIIPFYYLGARKYLFLCATENGYNFVKDIIDVAEENLNALFEFVILTPKKMSKKVYKKLKSKLESLFRLKNLENYSFHKIADSADYTDIFDTLTEDIIVNRPRPGDRIPIGYDLPTVETIVEKQGFTIDEKHQVITQLDDVNFIIDLKYNNVYAEMSTCKECEEECKVRMKLCVVVAIPGNSINISGLGDFRMISVLLAIKDGSFLDLKGEKPQEDIRYQLDQLRNRYNKKCKKLKK